MLKEAMQTIYGEGGVPIRYESINNNEHLKKVKCYIPITCCVPKGKRAWLFLLILFYLTLQSFVLLVFTSKHGVLKTVTQIKTIPTASQWDTYLKVLNNDKDASFDFCRMGLISYLHPPDQHTVALLAMRGSGGNFIRHLTQQSTRIWTGTEAPCLVLNQLGGYFDGECATPYHYKHFALTRFTSPSAITREVGYYPTKIIHLIRNPFISVISAYRYHLGCVVEGMNGIGCNQRTLKVADFNRDTWYPFAEKYAEEWSMQFTYVKAIPFATSIYFEDVLNNTANEMKFLLSYIANPLMVHPAKAMECLSRMNNPGMETMDVTLRKEDHDEKINPFSVELIMRMCIYLKEHFNQTKLNPYYC
jgi:hypothetical protein